LRMVAGSHELMWVGVACGASTGVVMTLIETTIPS